VSRHGMLWLSLVGLCLLPPRGAPAEPSPLGSPGAVPSGVLSRAHAHNDYEHARPLLDALASGFASVEADVWLVDGELLVAHTWFGLDPKRTLESLYLRPLLERVSKNHGHVYAGWPHSIQLLIDVKTDAAPTYLAVHRLLARYPQLFTTFVDGRAYESAVTAVISGNRARQLMQAQRIRYAACDGRSEEDSSEPADAMFAPLVSDRWDALFDWDGDGAMPADERQRLHAYVERAHERGQRVRFWATPDTPPYRYAVWSELLAAGVDYFNSDDLQALSAWLSARDPRPSTPEVDWFADNRRAGGGSGSSAVASSRSPLL
jgi:Glycerophosphoryl diester phosphodiesterase family